MRFRSFVVFRQFSLIGPRFHMADDRRSQDNKTTTMLIVFASKTATEQYQRHTNRHEDKVKTKYAPGATYANVTYSYSKHANYHGHNNSKMLQYHSPKT